VVIFMNNNKKSFGFISASLMALLSSAALSTTLHAQTQTRGSVDLSVSGGAVSASPYQPTVYQQQAVGQAQPTVYQQQSVYQQQPTVYQQPVAYGTAQPGLTSSTRGSVDLGGATATQAVYQQQPTVYQQQAAYQPSVASTGARGSFGNAAVGQQAGTQDYYVADGIGTPVGLGGTTVASQSRGSIDLQGDAFSSNVVAGSTTRGSYDLVNGEQLASVGTQTFVSGTTYNDGLPLVSEDFESLPIPSDEGDLFFGKRTSLAYNPALAASQRGLPVVVGQNESGNVVPGLPQPKYADFAGGQRYYGGNRTQVASASSATRTTQSSGGSSKSLRSKLKVKAPDRPRTPTTTTVASLPKPVAQPVLPAVPKAPTSPSVTSLLPSLTPSTTPSTTTTPTPTLGSGFVGGSVLSSGNTATTTTPTTTAALTKPKSDSGSKLIMQIIFPEGSAALPGKAESPLRSVAKKIIKDPSLNIQLRAYAKSSADGSAQSKRISLSRALAVRKFLIDEGVPSVRMDVRGLGDKSAGDKPDRLDILTVDGNS